MPLPSNQSSPGLLRAPVSGIIVPLSQVPDPVFAANIIGPGIAIDPTGEEIVAPCDGVISQAHPSGHAVGLTTSWGAQILIHVGLDTVKLRGRGFDPLVVLDQKVKEGEPLIRFDADYIATRSKSLLTEMVILNSDQFDGLEVLPGTHTKSGDPLLRVLLKSAEKGSAGTLQPATSARNLALKSEWITIHNATGIHARPAALLAAVAKRYKSKLTLVKGDRSADVRSLIAVMGLEVAQNDQVMIQAHGPDDVDALEALTRELKNLSEDHESPAAVVPMETELKKERKAGDLHFTGITASPGMTAGKIFQLSTQEIEVEEKGESISHETAKLEKAIQVAKVQLEALANGFMGGNDPNRASIFGAHQELLEDPQLLEMAGEEIDRGYSAAFAWKLSYTTLSLQLQNLKNQLLAARANDVRDIGKRVLQILVNGPVPAQEAASQASVTAIFPDNCIVVAEDLTPSDVATLDRTKVLGLCTTTGGATSHVAILARSLDIPALAGVDPEVLHIANGTLVVLDASKGELRLNPNAQELQALEKSQAQHELQKKEDLVHAQEPAKTLDGRRFEIVANLKATSEAANALQMGAEGVGLLRTEFLFMNRTTAPTENEQFEAYQGLARAFGKTRPLIIRTLDVGGDKPLPYLPLPKEDNPFLGERGIRVSLSRPAMFREQLRAILRASSEGDIRIMFPMISSLTELRQAKVILEEERKALGIAPVSVGIMIEVPSAAVMADHLADEADFFSIGSNDLSQYVLAIDRGHPKLAAQADGLDPSILRMIDMAVRAAHSKKKWVGVCGGIAGDPKAIPVLMGLGVDELSVSIPSIPAVKAQIRTLSQKDCEELAHAALEVGTAAEVRSLIENFGRVADKSTAGKTVESKRN
ncbi:MAG: phosphoenolpyruvate--protein phosphotransferase [Methylotenera sp.]|nr:phosphoenolpyruvate--protein phosphotransferase [Oligoflexia bacterium]